MNKPNRKSNLFTSLKSRKSLKDFKSLTSSPSFSTNLKSHLVDSTPLAAVDINTMSKRKSFIGGKSAASKTDLGGKPAAKSSRSVTPKISAPMPASDTVASPDIDTLSLHSTSVTMHSNSFNSNENQNSNSNNSYSKPEDDSFADFSHYLTFEQSYGARLPRTPNLETIRRMVENETIIPLNNRRSLDFEAQEIKDHFSRLGADNDVAVRLVENAFFMSFYQQGVAEREQARPWDVIDTNEVLKGDDVWKGDAELGLV